MSLITCPDCQKQISDQAPACPHCGRPMVTTKPAPQNIKVKKSGGEFCKAIQLIGAMMLCFGVVSCIYNGCDTGPKEPSLTPTIMIIGGFFTFMVGRFFE